jgi:hypothetical protein
MTNVTPALNSGRTAWKKYDAKYRIQMSLSIFQIHRNIVHIPLGHKIHCQHTLTLHAQQRHETLTLRGLIHVVTGLFGDAISNW